MNRLVVMTTWIAVALGWGCSIIPPPPPNDERVESSAALRERGEYIARYVAACGACHTERESGSAADPEGAGGALMTGGNVIRNTVMRTSIYVPGITSDKKTGIGAMTDYQLMRAIRDGVRADGRFLDPEHPASAYKHMSEGDVRAVVAYLRGLKGKQDRPRQENQMSWNRKLSIALGWQKHAPARNVPEPDRADPLKYGQYIAQLGNCAGCHSRGPTEELLGPQDRGYMGGAEIPFADPGVGKVFASNLTRDRVAGLGRYEKCAPQAPATECAEAIKVAILQGKRLDGKPMAPPMSVFTHYFAAMESEDLDALVTYLLSLAPVRHKVPPRELTPEARKRLGEP